MAKFIKSKGPGLLDQEFRAQELRLRKRGILVLDEIVNWELFRTVVEGAVVKEWKGNQGRPMFPPLKMFKVLVIQNYYHLSDERMEDMLLDSESFKVFAGFGYSDTLPDQKTIWRFREQLQKAGVFEEVFRLLHQLLEKSNIVGRAGVIVDATFVEVPRQHKLSEEKEKIEKGEIPEKLLKCPKVLRQKDLEARWSVKNNESYFGYKAHIKVDLATKLVIAEAMTPANVHDSQMIVSLVEVGDQKVFADKAYRGDEISHQIRMKNVIPLIHEKGYRGHSLQPYQHEINKMLSTFRARVEHVFGDVVVGMQGFTCRYIGEARVHAATQLRLLLYNVRRLGQMKLTTALLAEI